MSSFNAIAPAGSSDGKAVMEKRSRLMSWLMWAVLLVLFAATTRSASAQTQASYGQQIAVAKMLKTGLTTIGIFATNLNDKAVEQINRAATGQGIKIILAKPQDPSQISPFYGKLVTERKAEMIWIPDPNDQMLTGVGFEFLRAKALGDKIGLVVPTEAMVSSGGLCAVFSDGGKIRVIVNQRIAQMIGISVPSEPTASITYESK